MNDERTELNLVPDRLPLVGGSMPARVSSSSQELAAGSGVFVRRNKEVIVRPSQDRMVARKLRGINLSMITVNATLGSGLYWRGGQMLEIGGPLAAPLSFLLPGLLAWAVMQCVTEMLCIWPIPGALSVYVSEFVDVELGIAVGVAYWFTYSVSFAALITTSAAEFHYWLRGSTFDGVVVYLLIPLTLIFLNSFKVEIYGWLEVVGSSIKIASLVVVLVLVGVIIRQPSSEPKGTKRIEPLSRRRVHLLTPSYSMCLSMATFAYVGVEVVAASALEARWPRNKVLISRTVKFSAVYIPILATVAYTLAALLATLNINRANCALPRLAWRHGSECSDEPEGGSTSVFVIIAEKSVWPTLKDAFNVILVFSGLTCANTNLYVASRTLFGLTTRLDGSEGQSYLLRFLAWFGKTNRHKVPIRAMIFSALAFSWVPFLQLHKGKSITMFIEVLSTMGSNGVVIVWACECWAFIRFYSWHRALLEQDRVGQVRRWGQELDNDYPYRSHGQPLVAYAALVGCLFILIVANGASLWNGFAITPFLSSYLLPLAFAAVWILLKLFRGARWSLVDLDKWDKVKDKIRNLHDIRQGAS